MYLKILSRIPSLTFQLSKPLFSDLVIIHRKGKSPGRERWNGRKRKNREKEGRDTRKAEGREKKMCRILTVLPLGMALNTCVITCLFPLGNHFFGANHQNNSSSSTYFQISFLLLLKKYYLYLTISTP